MPVPLTSFTHLPQEIQDEIWTLLIPPPRMIALEGGNGPPEMLARRGLQNDSSTSHYVICVLIGPPGRSAPAILHICRASREVGLRTLCRYIPDFDHELGPPVHEHRANWQPDSETEWEGQKIPKLIIWYQPDSDLFVLDHLVFDDLPALAAQISEGFRIRYLASIHLDWHETQCLANLFFSSVFSLYEIASFWKSSSSYKGTQRRDCVATV